MRNEDYWGLGGIGGSPGIRLGLVILLCGSNGFVESGITHARWDVECDGINMKKSTDPISRGAKLFKPFIVKRPNGGCQILFPLSELDYLLGKLSKAMELPKSLMEEQKNRKANGAGQGAAKPYPEPAGSASLVAQPPRDVSELYHELLYAVARKFSGESRHETALRYIRDTEERAGGTGSCKQNTAVSGANGGLPK